MSINEPSRFRSALLVGGTFLVLAACGGGDSGGPEWTFHAPDPAPSGSPAGSPGGSPDASPGGSPGGSDGETIALTETSSVQIVQEGQQVTELTLTEGQVYTFEISNEGGLEHNFYIGSAEQLQANDVAGLPGVATFTEGTQTFEYTAAADTAALEFACTVLGHYEPMHGS
ncbi:MAG: hypothetical protein H0W00_02190, partial [Chloroflexi bacterium]|nr:hypothetical protein [Chloroflexota bacterium]